MIEQLKTWFSGRSQREQGLLAVAAGLAAIVLLVFGIVLPGYAAIGSAEKELDAAIQRRGAIEAVVSSAKSRSAVRNNLDGSSGVGSSLEVAVTESATAAGFELADGTAIGVDEYRFRLASTKAGALLAWITNLENQGIELSSISLRGGEGGFVSADVRVRRKI
jgi:general secretion pathway protein M